VFICHKIRDITKHDILLLSDRRLERF